MSSKIDFKVKSIHNYTVLDAIKKIDLYLEKYRGLFFALFILVLLKLPSLTEPYWYGDEGIYLTLGQAMNRGLKLYSEIIDHKTPIIYYLARVHTQLNFRILTMAWMAVATVCYYFFSKKILQNSLSTLIATLVFVLLTSVPLFEGNIPNGELFVIGFVMMGALFLSSTTYFADFFQFGRKKQTERWGLLVLSGIFFSLAILTKVPAVLDLGAFMLIGLLYLANTITSADIVKSHLIGKSLVTIKKEMLLLVGVLMPILASVIYFVAIGSGQEYLDFGLLYNFRYAGFWQIGFENPIVLFFFTLPGKVIVLFSVIGLLALLRTYLRPVHQFVFAWYVLALFASLLSNRPYPHYFLQMVPPFALLVTIVGENIWSFIQKNRASRKPSAFVPTALGTSILVGSAVVLFYFLKVGLYPFTSYYTNWWQLMTGQVSIQEYRQRFNHLMTDNYRLAAIIRESGEERLFIWGTNPMLYPLSNTSPSGRFTVSFHIKDFDAYAETIAAVRNTRPRYIVIMNDETQPFPELESYITKYYIPSTEVFDNFVVWIRIHKEL